MGVGADVTAGVGSYVVRCIVGTVNKVEAWVNSGVGVASETNSMSSPVPESEKCTWQYLFVLKR